MDGADTEAPAIFPLGMVKMGARVDEHRQPVEGKPNGEGICVTVCGQRAKPKRPVIEHEVHTTACDCAASDGIAAVAEGDGAVCRQSAAGRGEYNIAPMGIAYGRCQLRLAEKTCDRSGD